MRLTTVQVLDWHRTGESYQAECDNETRSDIHGSFFFFFYRDPNNEETFIDAMLDKLIRPPRLPAVSRNWWIIWLIVCFPTSRETLWLSLLQRGTNTLQQHKPIVNTSQTPQYQNYYRQTVIRSLVVTNLHLWWACVSVPSGNANNPPVFISSYHEIEATPMSNNVICLFPRIRVCQEMASV